MASGETEQNSTIVDTQEPTKKMPASSDGEETSTKATEENDSDTTMESKTSETKKDDNSDAETDVDDPSTSNEDSTTQEEKDKEAKENEEAEKKRIEELRIKYKDWPLKDIKDPHDNDVMYGRGGGTNHHPGNKRYRKLVEDRKVKYVNSKRLDKPMVALEIIRGWRAQLPSGRFLKHNDKTGNWDDVGDKKAREKTSQALREKAPQIKKQIQEEEEEKIGDDTGDKTTRFAKGTKENKKGKPKKGILARGHSLGTEYLASDENVDIEDFTWFPKKDGGKDTSIGSRDPHPHFFQRESLVQGVSDLFLRNWVEISQTFSEKYPPRSREENIQMEHWAVGINHIRHRRDHRLISDQEAGRIHLLHPRRMVPIINDREVGAMGASIRFPRIHCHTQASIGQHL